MKQRALYFYTMLLCAILVITGCSSAPKETPEQKLNGFKQAQAAIYDAWQATTQEELKQRLSKGLLEPFLSEQVKQQTGVMQQRMMLNEKHIVQNIIYNKLEISKDGTDEMEVYADWTVEGIREHGDIHQVRVSYRKHFHCVKKDGTWMIDKMTD